MSAPTAPEVTVRQCRVTLVRQGGWSWGPDPEGLVRQLLARLPDLLAAEYAAELAGAGPDVEIAAPVTLVVRAATMTAVRASPVVVTDTPAPSPAAPEPAAAPAAFEEPVTGESPPEPQTIAGFFAELAERGELEPMLALLPETARRHYVQAALDHLRADPGALPPAVADRLRAALPAPDAPGPPVNSATESTVDIPAARPGTAVETASALPFLLTGPLARIGYLDAIGPVLAEDAPLFAAALAYKVLGPVARGWRRTDADRGTAAAFAGLADVPDDDLTAFARRSRPALGVLDGVLALSLCRGHDPGVPLLLAGAAGGLLLADAQGLFPIAWSGSLADLLPHWEACGRPPVLVCDSPLPRRCLADLVAAGVPLITDVRPVRGDPLARLPWRTPLWTAGAVDLRLAADFPAHSARLAGFVRALVLERRAVPLAAAPDLERSVTLAASLSLGLIAWQLWHDRETPEPVLALSRFGDLDASVRFEAHAVRVRIPLGRRHADLLRAGLLADVPRVPWLGGRTLTFSGG
ncbi:hypothetical protein AB0J55_16585 [Amycolatopsis sp. NPDC049688]|uniref:hypothetical protein n=1 Tax=Amycolatopsis sp. NPDC049688 TaxID=3154733 RepID=UPI00342F23FD